MSYHYWLLPQPTLLVPWSIYSLFGVVGFFLILVIVLLLYVHLCIQPPAENWFISRPLLPVVRNIPRNPSVSRASFPDSLPSYLRSTLIVSAFSPVPCVYLASISISPPLKLCSAPCSPGTSPRKRWYQGDNVARGVCKRWYLVQPEHLRVDRKSTRQNN